MKLWKHSSADFTYRIWQLELYNAKRLLHS